MLLFFTRAFSSAFRIISNTIIYVAYMFRLYLQRSFDTTHQFSCEFIVIVNNFFNAFIINALLCYVLLCSLYARLLLMQIARPHWFILKILLTTFWLGWCKKHQGKKKYWQFLFRMSCYIFVRQTLKMPRRGRK